MNMPLHFRMFLAGGLLLVLGMPAGRAQSAYGQLQSMAGPPPNVPPVSGPERVDGGESGGASGGEERQPADLASAPIVVVPVGVVGGVFMGGGWYFSEMAGKYPKTGFLTSYKNYLTVTGGGAENATFNSSFSAGACLGGLPWLALYVPSWPIRQGVIAASDAMTRPAPPRPPKPPDPQIAVYTAIVANYAVLRTAADGELQKAAGAVQAADLRRRRFLDAFIADHADLRALRDSAGLEAARAQAQKRLDAWSRARTEKVKLAAGVAQSIQEKDAFCRAAIAKADMVGFSGDLWKEKKGQQVETLLADAALPAGARGALQREKLALGLVDKAKTVQDVAGGVKELHDSFAQARKEGKDAVAWLDGRETTERLLRLNLKLLPTLSKTSAVGLAASGAEGLMDGSYALTAAVLYSGQIRAERDLLVRLNTANVFADAAADDWNRLNISVEAARERERVLRDRRDHYGRMQKENEAHANRLRS